MRNNHPRHAGPCLAALAIALAAAPAAAQGEAATLGAPAAAAAAQTSGAPADPAAAPPVDTGAEASSAGLDEIVVVARKRQESLQETPIAITAFNAEALETKGINGLADFTYAPTPFLQVSPYIGAGSLPIIGIRGLATDDPGQGSNEAAVGIYLDGVYLGRAQGSGLELADVASIEILRGPQGTLFGRNALGGAINIVSKKPLGELGLRQTFDVGSFDEFRSLSHLDLPALGPLKIKGDFIYARRDGWVKNRDPGSSDFSAYKRLGGRVDALLDISDRLTAEYVYDISDDKSVIGYVQRRTPNDLSPLAVEPDRVRRSITPFPTRPSRTKTSGHALTATFEVSDALTLKSISAYRKVSYDAQLALPNQYVFVPLGADLALSGLITFQNDRQHQFSQELQATGAVKDTGIGDIAYAAGLYYFKEKVKAEDTLGAPLYAFPNGFGDQASAVILNPFVPFAVPNSRSRISSRSAAGYAQASITPALWNRRLELTVGLRYTDDRKVGRQLAFLGGPSDATFELKSNSIDYNVSLAARPIENVNLYARYATGYRGGGVSLRDPFFVPYKSDSADSFEVGVKSELFDRRARINLAAFATDFRDMRTSFSDPLNPTVTRLFNADKTTKIRGIEAEVTLRPIPDLTLSGAYSYLHTRIPPQANPFDPSDVQRFRLSQAPTHSGSASADWIFARTGIGDFTAHADAYWTSRVVSVPQLADSGDAYGLYNARLTWSRIRLPAAGEASLALWVRNLTDKKYRTFELAWIGPTATSELAQFGTPRTIGATLNIAY